MSPNNVHSGLPHSEYIRLTGITAISAITEVVCFIDGHIYAGIMTGNTVQFGWRVASGDWTGAAPIGLAIGCFVLGCLLVGVFRDVLKPVSRVYAAMMVLLIIASVVRLDPNLRLYVELPLLAFSVALQGVAFPSFAGVGIQTIVVTNNLVKFSRAFAARYLNPSPDPAQRPTREDVWVNGSCWLAYVAAAGIGSMLAFHTAFPLILPVVILVFLWCMHLFDPVA